MGYIFLPGSASIAALTYKATGPARYILAKRETHTQPIRGQCCFREVNPNGPRQCPEPVQYFWKDIIGTHKLAYSNAPISKIYFILLDLETAKKPVILSALQRNSTLDIIDSYHIYLYIII